MSGWRDKVKKTLWLDREKFALNPYSLLQYEIQDWLFIPCSWVRLFPPFMMWKLVWLENSFRQRFGRISVILPDNEADICGCFASFPSSPSCPATIQSCQLCAAQLSNFITEGMNERKLTQVASGEVYNGQTLNRLPTEVAESPSMEIFKRCVGVSLRHILVEVLAVLGLWMSKLSPGSFWT